MAILMAFAGSLLFFGCGKESPAPEESTVLWGQTSRIVGFDPVGTGDLASSRAMQMVYEGLLQYDYTARPYVLKPLLAESMPEVSDDGLTYRFTLRKGIFFDDDPCFPNGEGRELTAEDVAYSIKRLADVNTLSSGYWTVRGKIVGLDGFRDSSSGNPACYDQDVAGLQVEGRYELTIRLTEPYPQFPYVLAMHYLSVVPREAVDHYGDGFASHPVGTAAYRLRQWTRNYRVEYERNPAWDKHGRSEPRPQIERIVHHVIGDATTQWLMFASGKLDLISLTPDQYDSVLLPNAQLPADLAASGVQLHRTPTLDVYYIGFNMEDPLVGKNKALRQALSCAFDHESWVQLYNHQVEALHGPVPAPLQAARTDDAAYGFNLERARKLLADAGYPGGIDPATGRRLVLTMDTAGGDSAQQRQSNQLIASFMERIGVVLNINYSNRPTFFERVRRGDVQLFRLSWIADYPDEHNFLQLFYGPNAHGSNRANYRNPDYDKLFESFMVLPPSAEREALAARMVDMVVEDCPWIFTHQPVDTVLAGPRLENHVPHAFPGGMARHYRLKND